MTAEIIRWRRWPPGGIWVEKVLSWTVSNLVTRVLRNQEVNDCGVHQLEKKAKGGIWVEKVLSWTVRNSVTIQYYLGGR